MIMKTIMMVVMMTMLRMMIVTIMLTRTVMMTMMTIIMMFQEVWVLGIGVWGAAEFRMDVGRTLQRNPQ